MFQRVLESYVLSQAAVTAMNYLEANCYTFCCSAGHAEEKVFASFTGFSFGVDFGLL